MQPFPHQVTRPAAKYVVASVFLIAASLKCLSPEAFAETVTTIDWLPASSRQWLVFAVPAVEMILGLGLIIGPRPNRWLAASAALLTLFSLYLIWAAFNPWSPDCNCLGLIRIANDAKTAKFLSLLRNVLLLALLFHSYCPAHESHPAPPPHNSD